MVPVLYHNKAKEFCHQGGKLTPTVCGRMAARQGSLPPSGNKGHQPAVPYLLDSGLTIDGWANPLCSCETWNHDGHLMSSQTHPLFPASALLGSTVLK